MKKSLFSVSVLVVLLSLFSSCSTKYNPNNLDPSELIKVTIKPNLDVYRVDNNKCTLLTLYLPGKLYLEEGQHVLTMSYSDGKRYTSSNIYLDYNFIPGYDYKINYKLIGGSVIVMIRPDVETLVNDFSRTGFETPELNDSIGFLNVLPDGNDYVILNNLQIIAKNTLKNHTTDQELLALVSECAAELGADAVVDMKIYNSLTKVTADCTLIKYSDSLLAE